MLSKPRSTKALTESPSLLNRAGLFLFYNTRDALCAFLSITDYILSRARKTLKIQTNYFFLGFSDKGNKGVESTSCRSWSWPVICTGTSKPTLLKPRPAAHGPHAASDACLCDQRRRTRKCSSPSRNSGVAALSADSFQCHRRLSSKNGRRSLFCGGGKQTAEPQMQKTSGCHQTRSSQRSEEELIGFKITRL